MSRYKSEFAQIYRSFLLRSIRSSKPASGGKVINCRCFECGDSIHQTSAHFYISMPTDKEPSYYYCHKCNCAGIVTHRKLIEWGIFEPDIAALITEHNTQVVKGDRYRKYTPNMRYNLCNTYVTQDDTTLAKMVYVNNRLGTSFSLTDFMNLKIVLNLKDLLHCNGIQKITRDANVLSDLDRAFIGFLSLDNAFVTLRKLGDEQVYKTVDKRYVNYRIFEKEDTSERFYAIPTRVNLLQPGRIKLHIAEGAFDILSIYENLRHRENGIYASSMGSNYINIVFHFLMEAKIPNIELHLYPDNDKGGANWKMQQISQAVTPLQIPMYVHRNIAPNEKDFGVSIDRIQESIIPFNHYAKS